MKQLMLFHAFVFIATTLVAQNDTTDEMAIKNIIQRQEDSWNKHDWETLCSFFTEDGTLINFVGQLWKSRNDILAHFKLLSECCLEPTSLKFDFKQARFLTPDIAIVYTEETLYADRNYNVPFRKYKKGDTDYKWKIDVFVKDNGIWKVRSTQMTLINQQISPHSSSDNQ